MRCSAKVVVDGYIAISAARYRYLAASFFSSSYSTSLIPMSWWWSCSCSCVRSLKKKSRILLHYWWGRHLLLAKTPLRNEFLTPPNSPVREKRISRKTQMQNSFSSVNGLIFNPSQASEVNVNSFSLSPTTTIRRASEGRKPLFFLLFCFR